MLVWRGIEENEWLREFLGAVGRVRTLQPPPNDAPGPFSMSDPSRVRTLLEPAGWTDTAFTGHDEPMWFGPDADAATRFMVGQLAWLFATLDDHGKRQARANLHDVMSAHSGPDGVLLESGAWLVTARL